MSGLFSDLNRGINPLWPRLSNDQAPGSWSSERGTVNTKSTSWWLIFNFSRSGVRSCTKPTTGVTPTWPSQSNLKSYKHYLCLVRHDKAQRYELKEAKSLSLPLSSKLNRLILGGKPLLGLCGQYPCQWDLQCLLEMILFVSNHFKPSYLVLYVFQQFQFFWWKVTQGLGGWVGFVIVIPLSVIQKGTSTLALLAWGKVFLLVCILLRLPTMVWSSEGRVWVL